MNAVGPYEVDLWTLFMSYFVSSFFTQCSTCDFMAVPSVLKEHELVCCTSCVYCRRNDIIGRRNRRCNTRQTGSLLLDWQLLEHRTSYWCRLSMWLSCDLGLTTKEPASLELSFDHVTVMWPPPSCSCTSCRLSSSSAVLRTSRAGERREEGEPQVLFPGLRASASRVAVR